MSALNKIALINPVFCLLISNLITFLISLQHGYNAINSLNPSPINGTQQLYVALTRLVSRDQLGTDFITFHGPTWAFPFLPTYWFSHGNIFAIEFAKYFLNILTIPLVSGFFVYHFTRNRKFSGLLILVTVNLFYFGTQNRFLEFLPFSIINLDVLALASNAGFRYSVVFILILIFHQIRNHRSNLNSVGVLLGGFTIGIANDQGIFFTIAVLITIFIEFFLLGSYRKFLRDITVLFGFWISWLFWIFALSNFSMIGLIGTLEYYFVSVPGDQRWFFSTWPAANIISWSQYLRMVLPIIAVQLLLIWILKKQVKKSSNLVIDDRQFVAISLIFFSFLSTIPLLLSYKGRHYLIPTLISLTIASILIFANSSLADQSKHMLLQQYSPEEWKKTLLSKSKTRIKSICISNSAGILTTAIWIVSLALPAFIYQFGSNTTSKNWDSSIAAYSNLSVECKDGNEFWSDYPHYFFMKIGCRIPVGDLMIHAVGSRRGLYIDSFVSSNPMFVETSTVTGNPWMPWLRANNWQFYKHLYAQYSPIAETSHSILWKSDSAKIKRKLQFLGLNEINLKFLEKTSLTPPPEAKIGYLVVDYTIDRPLSFIPLIGNLGTFALSLKGTIYSGETQTISPKKHSLEIPIYLNTDDKTLEITPIYNSPRLFTSIKFKNASIRWFAPSVQGIDTFEASIK